MINNIKSTAVNFKNRVIFEICSSDRRGVRVRGSPTPPGKCVFPADCTRRTRTLPRVRSAVVLPTVGDPRRIRSLQPVQPAVLLLTAGHPRRTHSLLPVQPVVLFTCGGRVCHSEQRSPTKKKTPGAFRDIIVLLFGCVVFLNT